MKRSEYGYEENTYIEKTGHLLITTQYNDVKTNYVNVKTGKRQGNSKCKLGGERDDTDTRGTKGIRK